MDVISTYCGPVLLCHLILLVCEIGDSSYFTDEEIRSDLNIWSGSHGWTVVELGDLAQNPYHQALCSFCDTRALAAPRW